jgi:antitoxin component HigA of HigAB toxin-antitoxin module
MIIMNHEISRKIRANYVFSLVLFLCLFISCQTMQNDTMISTTSETSNADILELESSIVSLDDGDFSQNSLRLIRARIDKIEKSNQEDSFFKSQVAAWSGRLFLLEGNVNGARKSLEDSDRFFPGNIQSLVLAVRLETDLEKRLLHVNEVMQLEPNSGELSIEKARVLFELKRYSESAAFFDTSFNQIIQRGREIAALYEDVYQDFRMQAWDLRNISSETSQTSAIIMQKEVLTWLDVINLTVQETKLLDFLTAGRTWQVNDLFTRLVSQGFIPPSQNVSLTEWSAYKANSNDIVLRSGAAWFLWHVYAENRADIRLLTRYSSVWKSTQRESPFSDIPVPSPFFDSILSCVEMQFIASPDGVNFQPEDTVRGTSFRSMLEKVTE